MAHIEPEVEEEYDNNNEPNADVEINNVDEEEVSDAVYSDTDDWKGRMVQSFESNVETVEIVIPNTVELFFN